MSIQTVMVVRCYENPSLRARDVPCGQAVGRRDSRKKWEFRKTSGWHLKRKMYRQHVPSFERPKQRLEDNIKNSEVKLSLFNWALHAVKSYEGAEKTNPLIVTLTLDINFTLRWSKHPKTVTAQQAG
jgi:hypothetical protein